MNPAIAAALESPQRFYVEYRYREEDNPVSGATPPKVPMLSVRFAENAIQKLINDSGLPLWSSNRPTTLAWVAVAENGARSVLGARRPDRVLPTPCAPVPASAGCRSCCRRWMRTNNSKSPTRSCGAGCRRCSNRRRSVIRRIRFSWVTSHTAQRGREIGSWSNMRNVAALHIRFADRRSGGRGDRRSSGRTARRALCRFKRHPAASADPGRRRSPTSRNTAR